LLDAGCEGLDGEIAMKKRVADWLTEELGRRGLNGHVHESSIRKDAKWFYVPVYIDERDAYLKALLLQNIEDEWEKKPVVRGHNLLLTPAAN
jgi:hypothetical protein